MKKAVICRSDKLKLVEWFGEEILSKDKEALLDALVEYMLVSGKCFDKKREITDFGREVLRVRDNIFYEDVDLDS